MNISFNNKYINSEPIVVTTQDLKTLIELEQYQVKFTDEEIFSFKIGNIPNGTFALVHERNKSEDLIKEMPYISFYTEAARNTLEKINNLVKTVNINSPTYGLRFNKIHSFFKRELTKESALEKINQIISVKTFKINEYKRAHPQECIVDCYFSEEYKSLLKDYNELQELQKEIQFSTKKFSFIESNYFRFKMVDYVYLKLSQDGKKFERTRFNLCTKLPNAIILNQKFKDSLNRRVDKKLDKMLLQHSTILTNELFPYDLFFKQEN